VPWEGIFSSYGKHTYLYLYYRTAALLQTDGKKWVQAMGAEPTTVAL
jgi:hypothetical protein